MEFKVNKFHPLYYASDPYDLLLPIETKDQPTFSGPCEFHLKNFGTELTVHRNSKSSRGYYVCLDCKAKERIEKDKERYWAILKPLRESKKQQLLQQELEDREAWIKAHARN